MNMTLGAMIARVCDTLVRIASLAVICTGAHGWAQCDGRWLTGGGVTGVSGSINTMLVTRYGMQERLYAGGQFKAAGATRSFNITYWDGSRWNEMGRGFNKQVSAIAEYQGEIIAAGIFDLSGESSVSHIARWDGDEWRRLGLGITGNVTALAVYNGELFAGGMFASIGGVVMNNIARWDGSEWRAVGGGLSSSAGSMAVWNGKLYVSGSFTSAGGVPASKIACWDGYSWSALGVGLNASTTCMTEFQDRLIVAGSFSQAGGIGVSGAAAWDGSAWSALTDSTIGTVWSLRVFGDELIMGGGTLRVPDSGEVSGIVAWNGQDWRAVGLHEGRPSGRALAIYRGSLIAGGSTFETTLDPAVCFLDGETWRPLRQPGWEGVVEAVAAYDEYFFAGGTCHYDGQVQASSVARFADGEWLTMPSPAPHGRIKCFAVLNNELYLGGVVCLDGEECGLAVWNGASWRSLGPGTAQPPVKMGVFGGSLIGAFNGAPVARLWNGTEWVGLVGGLTPGAVLDFEEWNGELYAAVRFESGSGVGDRLLRWDGKAWNRVGRGFTGDTTSLCAYRGKLMVGGYRVMIDDVRAAVVAWDGVQASAVLADGLVDDMVEHAGDLVAVGFVNIPNTTGAGRWDGVSWRPIPGLPHNVTFNNFSVATNGRELIVGGDFAFAGGVTSAALAIWRDDSGDFNHDGSSNGVDFDLFVLAYEAGERRADRDGDGFVTGSDFDLFVQVFEAGC